jgi:hypothetical protein
VRFFFCKTLLTVNICVDFSKFNVKRQTTSYKLIIYIKINKVKSYFFLKVGKELVI